MTNVRLASDIEKSFLFNFLKNIEPGYKWNDKLFNIELILKY